jgi:tetratricopeptide (TPR) repeat protein
MDNMTAAIHMSRGLCLATVLAWVLVCLGSEPVSAQNKHEASDYQHAVQQALHEYDLGNFSEAKAFFTQAHSISPNARTLRGLGMSSYELRTYVEAIGYFEQSLNSTERPLTVAMRGEVSQLLQQARTFVTRLRVTLEPASAQLRIDTRPVTKDAQGVVLLDPGTHELVAEAPEYEAATRSIRTDGGEELALTITLHKPNEAKAETLAEVPAPAAVAATQAGPSKQGGGSSLGPWILIGSGAALTVAGGVMLGLMVKNKNTVEGAPPESQYNPKYKNAEESVFPLSVAGFVTAGVGVAALIGGVIWKVSADGSRESASLEVLPGGMRVSGRF